MLDNISHRKNWSQMKKSWYQILNIFQSPSPSVSDSILRGCCVDICKIINIFLHRPAIRNRF